MGARKNFLIIDPCQHYLKAGVGVGKIVDATGLVFNWVVEAVSADVSLREHLKKRYAYPMFCTSLSEKETVDEFGVYTYKCETNEEGVVEPDEVYYPLIQAETSKDVLFMYQHALVVFIDQETKETTVGRID